MVFYLHRCYYHKIILNEIKNNNNNNNCRSYFPRKKGLECLNLNWNDAMGSQIDSSWWTH